MSDETEPSASPTPAVPPQESVVLSDAHTTLVRLAFEAQAAAHAVAKAKLDADLQSLYREYGATGQVSFQRGGARVVMSWAVTP